MAKQSLPPRAESSVGEGQAGHWANERAARRWQPGVIVADRFRLARLLGTGAMGDVWCALDLELDETVALKRLRDQPSAGGRMAELFRREVRLARRISHRNVARVFELLVIKGAESAQLALTMEYVQGHTLAELLKGGQPFEPASVVRVLRDTCAGLSAVHEAGVVHRDIKPGNVMLGEADRVVLMDFGVALAARDALAERGMLAGTPAYMAPELYAGAEASVASDVYALGCLAYELLTGQRAFDGTNLATVLSAKGQRLPVPFVDEVPGLSAVIEACLDPTPTARFPDVAELEGTLARLGAPPAPVLRRVALAPSPPIAPAATPMLAAPQLTIERERPQLAVLPLETHGVGPGLAELLVDDFIGELSRRKSLRVLATGSVKRMQSERGRGPLAWVDVGSGLGASVVVGGEASAGAQGVEVALRAISVPKGLTLWRWQGAVSTGEPLPSMAAAAQSLLRSEHLAAFEGPASSSSGELSLPRATGLEEAGHSPASNPDEPGQGRTSNPDEPEQGRTSSLGEPGQGRTSNPDEPGQGRTSNPDEPGQGRTSSLGDTGQRRTSIPPPLPTSAPRATTGRSSGPPPLPSTPPPGATPALQPSAAGAAPLPPSIGGGTVVLERPGEGGGGASPPRRRSVEFSGGGESRVLELYLRGRELYLSTAGPDLAEAVRCFEEAQAAAPEDPRIASALTVTLGRYLFVAPAAMGALLERAEQAAEHALRVAPSMGEPHHAHAVILLHRGLPIEAVRSLRRALRCAPSLVTAHGLLGQLLLEAGHEAEGQQRLVAADRLEPGNVETYWPLYRFSVLANRRAEADAALDAMMRATRGLRSHWALHLRVAAWRRDRGALMAVETAALRTLAPASPLPAFGAFAAVAVRGEPPAHSYATLHRLGADEGASMRTRCFHYQVLAEVAGFVGDAAEAARAIGLARSTALFDRSWLELCPLLACARGSAEYEGAVAQVRAYADAMRHAYYSETEGSSAG